MTAAERFRQIMDWTGWSAREWARRAGLREESHVNRLISRLENEPDAAVNVDTLARLADAAKVSLDWLWLGRGLPGAIVEGSDDPRYVSRGKIISALWLMGYPPEVGESLLTENGFVDDPGVEYWLDRARTEARRIGIVEGSSRAKSKRAR